MNSGDISINEWTPYYTRKNMPAGPENAPNGAALGLATTNTDDGYTPYFNLPFPFYFYGTNLQNTWCLNINGNMARNQDGDYTNTWNEFIGGGFNKIIAPIWVDLMVQGLDDAVCIEMICLTRPELFLAGTVIDTTLLMTFITFRQLFMKQVTLLFAIDI